MRKAKIEFEYFYQKKKIEKRMNQNDLLLISKAREMEGINITFFLYLACVDGDVSSFSKMIRLQLQEVKFSEFCRKIF